MSRAWLGLPDESICIAAEDGNLYVAVTKNKVTIKNEDTTAEFTAAAIDIKTSDMTITANGLVNIKGSPVDINGTVF